MSHIEKCAVAFTDLKALQKACETLGVKFVEGKKTFQAYFGANNPCEHAITAIPGTSYEVGLEAVAGAKVPTWTAKADFFSHHGVAIKKALGTDQAAGKVVNGAVTHNLHGLANEYSVEVLKAKARSKGYQFRQVRNPNGQIKLVVTLGN